MIKKIFFLCSLFFLSCTSDNVIRSEKASFYNIYKNIIFHDPPVTSQKVSKHKEIYDREWLSKFNQPIILLSSLDEKSGAILVALGNYQNRLTWVSSDGISISFKDGILIGTRGYSQDLLESQHNDLHTLFTSFKKNHSKTFRYLDGQNEYEEFNFSCSVLAKPNTIFSILDLKLNTTKFTEICESGETSHTNEYYVLPNTNIVLKSKQWISETNGYITIYNFYAFQNNLL